MRKAIYSAILLFCAILAQDEFIFAYEVKTHKEITKNALLKSTLGAGYLSNIGMTLSDKLSDNMSVQEWMQFGADREDETVPTYDPVGQNFRYMNHFFDPYYNRGYEHCVGNLRLTGYKTPDWALEDNGTYNGQFYSIPHVKEYYLAGLTATTATERQVNLAKAFRGLGQVLHTIQDMAQPQHTRNDSHGGSIWGTANGYQIFGEKSVYETKVDNEKWLKALNYSPPYIAKFDSYRKYYVTGDGKGLAEFSNKGFVTAGTNFDWSSADISTCNAEVGSGYPQPQLDVNQMYEIDIKDLSPGTPLEGKVTFFGNTFTDNYSGETIQNEMMTTFSIFDKDLKNKGAAPAFSLNDFNYSAMASILIPRAVGYSAGLLNYFFRGQMDTSGHETTDLSGNVTGISVDVKNLTTNEDMSDGRLVVSYRYKASGAIEYTYVISNEVNSGTLISNAPDYTPFTFTFSNNSIPKDATDVQYTLVFHDGYLGNEQNAVVGKIVDTEAFKIKLTRDDGIVLTPAALANPANAPDGNKNGAKLGFDVFDSNGDWVTGGYARFSLAYQSYYQGITFDEATNHWKISLPLGYTAPIGNKGFWIEYYSSFSTPYMQYPRVYKDSEMGDDKDLIQPGIYEDTVPLWWVKMNERDEINEVNILGPNQKQISEKVYSSIPYQATYGYYYYAAGYYSSDGYNCGWSAGNGTISTDGGESEQINGVQYDSGTSNLPSHKTFTEIKPPNEDGYNLILTLEYNGPDTVSLDGHTCSLAASYVGEWGWNMYSAGVAANYDY